MANYDGPIPITFSPPGFTIDFTNGNEVPYFTSQPNYGSVPAYGTGGSGGGGAIAQDMNGYGYSHSG